MTFPLEICRANCRICTLAAIMRDCKRCQFYGSWSPTVHMIIVDDLHGPQNADDETIKKWYKEVYLPKYHNT